MTTDRCGPLHRKSPSSARPSRREIRAAIFLFRRFFLRFRASMQQVCEAPHSPCPKQIVTRPLRDLDALVNRRVYRNPIHVQQLKCAKPQRNRTSTSTLAFGCFSKAGCADRDRSASAELPAQALSSGDDRTRRAAVTFLPRSKSSECPLLFSMSFRIANAARRAGETSLMALTKPHPGMQSRAPQKIGGGHALLAFHLQLGNLDPRILRARNQQPMVRKIHCVPAHLQRSFRLLAPDAQSVSCLRESCTLPATAENPASDSKVPSPYGPQNPYVHLRDQESVQALPARGPAASA